MAESREDAHEQFGGANWGAAFFGWLVAVGITVLLSSVIAAVATAVESTTSLTMDDAQREAGAIGLGTAIAVLCVMLIAYYTGGYVAGRMSRFDGGRQGVAVWAIGLVVTLIAVAVGAVLGDQYNVMDRVDLPRLPVPDRHRHLGRHHHCSRHPGRHAAGGHGGREGRAPLPQPGRPGRLPLKSLGVARA